MFLPLAVLAALLGWRRIPLREVPWWWVCVHPALFTAVQATGLRLRGSPALDVAGAGAVVAALALRARWARGASLVPGRDAREAGAMAAAFIAALAWLLGGSALLPGHDAAVIPAYAKLIHREGAIPETLWPLGVGPFVYPPGYPILLAPLFSLGSPGLVLAALRVTHVLAVGLTPLAWAVFLRRLLGLESVRLPVVVAGFSVGFLLFDRTLVLAVPLKHAQLLAAALTPAVLWSLLAPAPGRARRALACVAAAGLCLIHYSAVHLLGLGIVCFGLVAGRERRRAFWRGAATFAASLALLLPFWLELRERQLDLSPPALPWSARLARLGELVLPLDSPTLFIFQDAGVRWPGKNLAIAGLLAAGIALAAARRRRGAGAAWEGRALAFCALAIGGSLVLAAGWVPQAGIDWRYARWILYDFVAALAGVVATQALLAAGAAGERWRAPARALVAAGLAAGLLLPLAHDLRRVRAQVRRDAVTAEELADVAAQLSRLAAGRPCILLTRSSPALFWKTQQAYRPLEYAWVVSECAVLNGSWVAPPAEHARDVDGLPSPAFYSFRDTRLPRAGAARIVAVTTPEHMERYRAALPRLRWRETPIQLGPLRAWVLERRGAGSS